MGIGASMRDSLRGLHTSLWLGLVCFGLLQPPFIVCAETTETDTDVLSLDVPAATGPVTVTRSLPEAFTFPGQVAASLTIDVGETDFPAMLNVEEDIPARWGVAEASPPYDAFDGDVVTWIFEGEAASHDRIIAYSLDVPADYCNEEAVFGGAFRYLFDGFQYTLSIGGDDRMESDDGCVGIKDLSPDFGLPGDQVEFSGYCYYYHSGGPGDLYFDGEYLVTTSGDTVGNFSGVFSVPQDAGPGEHVISCESCTCSGIFLVVTPTVTVTPTPAPPQLVVEPATLEICESPYEYEITVFNGGGGELVVTEIDLTHSYSQGLYGTGFDWNISGIVLPATLEHLTPPLIIPVTYDWSDQDFPSGLTISIKSNAGDFFNKHVGYLAATPTPTETPTATNTPTPMVTPTPILGDINGDGRVDGADLYLLLRQWHQGPEE